MLKLAIFFTLITTSLTAINNVNTTNGDEILLIKQWGFLGFEIQASIQTGGIYSATSSIADPLTDPRDPLGSINASQQAVAIWRGNDILLGTRSLYAASFQSGVWSSPVLISVPALEDVTDEYQVTVADTGTVVITWKSYLLLSNVYVIRTMYSSIFGTWTAPVTVL